MKAINCLTLLYLFLNIQTISAQTGIIKGRALDNENKHPVEFASVTLLSAQDSSLIKGELTDSTGHFQLAGLENGQYILVISSIEYQKIFRGPLHIDLAQEALDLGDLPLVADAKALAEVVILGSKPIIERTNGGMVLNMSNKFFKTATNAIDVLKKAPGIRVGGDGSLTMHGSITPNVFVDGKDIQLHGDELINYLNSLTPDMIESIEVINNPSAKYDAQYKGIIDIKLKRDKTLGWSGNYTIGYKYNGVSDLKNGLNLNYKAKKWALNALTSYRKGNSLYYFNSDQRIEDGKHLLTDTEIRKPGDFFNTQVGLDFFLSKQQTLGITYKTYLEDYQSITNTVNQISGREFQANEEELLTDIDENNNNNNNTINLFSASNWGKSKLNVSGTFATFKNKAKQDIQSKTREVLSNYLKSDLNNTIDIFSTQADFSTPVLKGNLELGGKFAHSNTENKLRFDKLENEQFVVDLSRTNNFDYKEKILAGYASFSQEVKQWNYQLGLRMEQTATSAVSHTTKSTTQREYINWLPSFSLAYKLSDEQNLNLALTNNLRRPNYFELNPFQTYLGPYTYAIGNPFLNPERRSMLSLNYSYKNLGISLGMGQTKSPIVQVPFYDKESNVTVFLRSNIDKQEFAMIEGNHSISIRKWWRTQHSVGAYYDKKYLIHTNKNYQAGIWNYYLRGSHTLDLPKEIAFELQYEYNPAGGDVLYITRPTSDISLSLQRNFPRPHINAKLSFNDIFYGSIQKLTSRQEDILVFKGTQKYATRSIGIQLTWNFGQSTYKARQRKNTEEENRAK